jgi:hypothetical protein
MERTNIDVAVGIAPGTRKSIIQDGGKQKRYQADIVPGVFVG